MQIEIEAFPLAVDIDPEADDQVDELEQNQRDDRVVADGAPDAVELDQHLMRIAVDQTALAGAADRRNREHAGEEGSDRPTDAMDAERIEAVVVPESVLETGRAPIAKNAGGDADDQRAARIDKPRSRGDRDQAGNGAGADPEDAWPAFESPFDKHPSERG